MEGAAAAEAAGAGTMCMPLYETLTVAFPQGLMPEGLEHSIRSKVRKRLRDIGYRVVFPPGEPWQTVLEHFAIAGIERIHRGFGDNPWFWVVAWPSVFGAAAADFWPEVGTPEERRAVAADASAAHLEAILITRALGDAEAVGALPMPAVKGLRAAGRSALPALPTVGVNEKALLTKSGPTGPSGGIAPPPIAPYAAAPTALSPDAGDEAGRGGAKPAPAGPGGASAALRKQPDVPAIASWQVRTPMPAGALKLLRPPPQPTAGAPEAGGADLGRAGGGEPAAACATGGSAAPSAPAAEGPGGGDVAATLTPPDPWLGKRLGAPAPLDPRLGRQSGGPTQPDPWSGMKLGVPSPPSWLSTEEKDAPQPQQGSRSAAGCDAASGAAAAAESAGPPQPRPLARKDGQPCECGSVAVRMETASEVYGEHFCAACDACCGPCGADGPDEARRAPFLHCAACGRDRCAPCAGI